MYRAMLHSESIRIVMQTQQTTNSITFHSKYTLALVLVWQSKMLASTEGNIYKGKNINRKRSAIELKYLWKEFMAKKKKILTSSET